jgi:hypothetical protein
MKRSKAPVITGVLIALVMVVGLLVSLLFLIYPTQAGPAVLRNSVNVAATAQAIQTDHRQRELEETRQARQAVWNSEIDDKEGALTTFEQQALTQTDQLHTELETLQDQIDQVRLNIQETQQQILTLQQAIDEEQVNYQQNLVTLEQEMSQTENELRTELEVTDTALTAARAELANSGAPAVSGGEADNGVTAPADSGSSEPEPGDDNQDGEDRSENDEKEEGEDRQEDEKDDTNNKDKNDSNDDDHDGKDEGDNSDGD